MLAIGLDIDISSLHEPDRALIHFGPSVESGMDREGEMTG